MSDQIAEQEPSKNGKGKLGLIIGLVLMGVAGGAGYYVTSSGLFPLSEGKEMTQEGENQPDKEVVAFVPMPPMVVSLGPNASAQLRFQAQFEVTPSSREDVANLMPRIQDVLNGYLRAVDYDVLREPSSLIRLRAQMLRRVQLVAGSGNVQDLLITEFVFG